MKTEASKSEQYCYLMPDLRQTLLITKTDAIHLRFVALPGDLQICFVSSAVAMETQKSLFSFMR